MYGDIIYVERRAALFGSIKERLNEDSRLMDKIIMRCGFYRHFGIEVENGYVIHFHTNSFHRRRFAEIKKVTMDEFLANGKGVILRIVGERFSKIETVARAYEALHTPPMPYSINRNNCEHFAMWCATGSHSSSQSYFIEKGQNVLLYPTKFTGKVISVVPYTLNMVGPLTKRTKNRTVKISVGLYKKILRRA